MALDYKNHDSTYDKFPTVPISDNSSDVFSGYQAIITELTKTPTWRVFVVDCYPGVDDREVLSALKHGLRAETVILSEDIFYDKQTLTKMMQSHLTDDRVRGVMYYGKITDFVDPNALSVAKQKVEKSQGVTLIYGVGASLISCGDTLVYADLARWEIQLRYRKGLPNFKQDNYNEDFLRKYKRAYFIEWRIADKHKRTLLDRADYWLDTNKANRPKMISGHTFKYAMDKIAAEPFRTVPYFDPGVWGGQWMKGICGLDKNEKNFAWSFDGVPEENSVLLRFADEVLEFPSINAIFCNPVKLLGNKVYARFGADFPIRFDFLDTFEGQNLSLQVHPTTDFAKSQYGMPYTQEESYYILDAGDDAKIYLGMKSGVDKTEFFERLEQANRGEMRFDAKQYINTFPAKMHDHFLIPPGTVHCSAKNCLVLEISSSAYIFTFKMWDWDRLGLDGLPRPVHLEEAKAVLNFDFDTEFVTNQLINRFEVLQQENGCTVEKTGLHELEFLGTKRYSFNKAIDLSISDSVHMLNLIEGDEIEVSSIDNSFNPIYIHYAETFIIPASVKQYRLTPVGRSTGKRVKVLQAFLK